MRRTGFHPYHDVRKGMKIEVRDLTFSYPGSDRPVLNGITFTVDSGERMLITGPADGGKNTIVRLILGLYPTYKGSIVYDGFSLRDLKLPYLRSEIGENILNSVVYDCTLLNNITMGRAEATPSRLTAIIRDLKLDEIIYQHPDGLSANSLSGQVQLSASSLYKLTMARALVTKPQLVIIDDQVMTLSEEDRDYVLNYVMRKDHSWTVIFISDHEEMKKHCDHYLFLEKGRIINEKSSSTSLV
jgi:ABC-type bacteriocin/lantibiotic exporter with double-glycine peptidase domain